MPTSSSSFEQLTNELSTQSVSRVLNAIAGEEGIDPLAVALWPVAPPLAEVVVPDALETLIEATTASNPTVNVTYRDHEVVDADGRVQVS